MTELGILDGLAAFSPILVATVCLDIDTAASDLDIICHAPQLETFSSVATALYGSCPGFLLRASGRGATVASFHFAGLEFEIFAQPVQVHEQNAYRHLCQTARVIRLGGDPWKHAIRRLKERGMKTEPAVALCLALEGDPFEAVLSLEETPDAVLAELVRERRPALEKLAK